LDEKFAFDTQAFYNLSQMSAESSSEFGKIERQKWEYWTGFIGANAEGAEIKKYLKEQWPNWNPSKYSPESMIPGLNKFGEEGWELVHMQPIAGVGKNMDVFFQTDIGSFSAWYFCVFKRPKL